jgi:hypothetical protein
MGDTKSMDESYIAVPKSILTKLNIYRAGFYLLSATSIIGVMDTIATNYTIHADILPTTYTVPYRIGFVDDTEKYRQYILNRSNILDGKLYADLAGDISKNVISNSKKYNLPPSLILGVMEAESGFKPFAVSNKNAQGLMQLNMQANATILKHIVTKDEIFDPAKNIEAGCFLLRKFLDERKTLDAALNAYLGADIREYKDAILKSMARITLMETYERSILW